MADKISHDEFCARGGRSRSASKLEAARNTLEKAKAALAAAFVGGRAFGRSFCSFRRAAPAFLLFANPLVVRAQQLFERAEVTKATNMEEHFLRPLFAGCSQSHLSGDPLFKPLLANFALFATALFLGTLMVHDEVDLILPSEVVLSPTMNATSLGKLMKLIKTKLGEKPFSIPSEQSVISEQELKYLISGVSSLRTSCEQSPLLSLAQAKLQTMRAAGADFYRYPPFHCEPGTGSSLKIHGGAGARRLGRKLCCLALAPLFSTSNLKLICPNTLL